MYLKEVRMENFKSFGRKLTVPFGRGFTAITGPNGSGKSNIGDAILFVLGPRSSKAIRAGKLSELIFNGGKDGKPAQECRVSLAFDNTDRLMPLDADEVILTRRVKRAPKPDDPDAYYSYFYINGGASALKEFADLLDHARISADGYNIVTQGSVQNIVTMGAVDRRRILEQIAGITEFDKDIERAEKQKEEAEANLEKIGIILGEIQRSMRQLKKDRDGAMRYQELTSELTATRGMRALALKREMENRIARIQENIAKLQADREKAVERANEERGRERELVKELAAIDKEIEETGGEELRELNARLQALREDRARRDQDANYAHDEIQELAKELSDERAQLARFEKELETTLGEVQTHEALRDEIQATVTKLDQEVTAFRDTAATTDSDAMQVQKHLSELKKTWEAKTTERHEAQLANDRFIDRLSAADESLAALADAVHAASTDRDEARAEIEEIEEASDPATLKALEKEHVERKKRQTEITKEADELERAASRMRTELAELRAQKDAAEGVQRAYSRAVDAVLAARDKGKLTGIYGTIAELGSVDKKYATAIETAAGARSQCIVVESAQDAQAAIEYLRKNKIGRATFLPMDKMAKSMPRGKALMVVKDPAAAGFALDLIKFDKKYENAFSYVFGDSIVVTKLEDARRLMGGVRLVTLTGDLIEASGAMTGGASASGKGVGFAGVDTSRIEELARNLHAATTHLESLSEEAATLRTELVDLEDRVRAMRGSAEELAERQKRLAKRLEDTEKGLEQATKKHAAKEAELESLKAEQAEAEDTLARLNDRLADIEAEREDHSRRLLAFTDKNLADRIRKREAELAEAREALREAEKKWEIAKDKARLQEERVVEVRTRIERRVQAEQEHQEEIGKAKGDIQGLDEAIKALEDEERHTSGAMEDLHKRRDDVKDRLNAVKNAIERFVNEAETGWGLIAREKERLPAIEEELAEAIVELRETQYTHPEEQPLPPLDELKLELRRIEGQIRELGPINQRALEEYESAEGRRAELDEEVARLNEERDKLVELVTEIVKKKREDFMRVFSAINENFKQVYTRLSEGGSAFLALEQPEDPFAGGLTMMARPRGKKVIRIEALSGGEKSMTALAFIFAVQEYEPSPFYYLDEVDQNLDGVNSDTIGKVVAANARRAQFIMVSLRKVTLRQADHIYGVTMQKIGLSQIVGDYDVGRLKDPDDTPDLDPIKAVTRLDVEEQREEEARRAALAATPAPQNGAQAPAGSSNEAAPDEEDEPLVMDDAPDADEDAEVEAEVDEAGADEEERIELREVP